MSEFFYTTKQKAHKAGIDWQLEAFEAVKYPVHFMPVMSDNYGNGWTFREAVTEEDAFVECCNCGFAVDSVEDQHGFCDDCISDTSYTDMEYELSSVEMTGRV